MVYAPNSPMQVMSPEPIASSATMSRGNKKQEELKMLEDLMLKKELSTKKILEIIGVGKAELNNI
jgi:hypothetical protein